MTRTERDSRDGTLTPEIRARIAEAYQRAPETYQKAWEGRRVRTGTTRYNTKVPGLKKRLRAAGVSQDEIAREAQVSPSTVRRALRLDTYSDVVLAAARRLLDDDSF